ncbi:circadian clock protein KaiC [Acidobacteria bacterium AH-259-L09]|nr:circadian clock protein KaiC [Acidobacteria bacterium AH-259-L09]
MSAENKESLVEKLEIGILGFDQVANGGLPKSRTTLLAGTAGSGKTVFAVQFLAEGIMKAGENGVFVTFEEHPKDIRKNMRSLGWDISQWEDEGKWAFVDASPQPGRETIVSGEYDFGALLARIENAAKKVAAKRMTLDSISSVFTQFQESSIVRSELFRVALALKDLEITAILTAERIHEYGEIARYGVEEFVADNVIIFRNVLEQEKRRRTLEILKFRGTSHQKGEFPFTISPETGVTVIPLSAMELKQESSNVRIKAGNAELDRMCGGGFFRDSITLISGATGNGKTLMVTEFVAAGAASGERCLVFAFEESREQLNRNARGWGIDFDEMEKQGKLKVVCNYPEMAGLEDHLISMKRVIEEFRPDRVAVDSLSALERVSTIKAFREFVIALTSLIKDGEIAGLFTATTPALLGGTSVTETHISTITDSIILLRYVELWGEMRRGITILKMRGSAHDKDIREYIIDGDGMHIGEPFRGVSGILSGHPTHAPHTEMERIEALFQEEEKVG